MQIDSECQEAFQKCLQDLGSANGVAVASHMRPDGDSVGSQIALVRLLASQGIHAFGVYEDPIPLNMQFLLGDTPLYHVDQALPEWDRMIYVDCADRERPGERIGALSAEIALNIDHHPSNTAFAQTDIIVPTAAATAQVLASLAQSCELVVDEATAQALYVGLMTDTGQFAWSNTTVDCFHMAAFLAERGANIAECARELYHSFRKERLDLWQQFLATLQLHARGRLAAAYLTESMYAQTETTREDSEGFVEALRGIRGVDVAVLMEAVGEQVKFSMRSHDVRFALDRFAQERGGGGHACAAGIRTEGDAQAALSKLLDELEAHIQAIES